MIAFTDAYGTGQSATISYRACDRASHRNTTLSDIRMAAKTKKKKLVPRDFCFPLGTSPLPAIYAGAHMWMEHGHREGSWEIYAQTPNYTRYKNNTIRHHETVICGDCCLFRRCGRILLPIGVSMRHSYFSHRNGSWACHGGSGPLKDI